MRWVNERETGDVAVARDDTVQKANKVGFVQNALRVELLAQKETSVL